MRFSLSIPLHLALSLARSSRIELCRCGSTAAHSNKCHYVFGVFLNVVVAFFSAIRFYPIVILTHVLCAVQHLCLKIAHIVECINLKLLCVSLTIHLVARFSVLLFVCFVAAAMIATS